jgi:hypothetical protein
VVSLILLSVLQLDSVPPHLQTLRQNEAVVENERSLSVQPLILLGNLLDSAEWGKVHSDYCRGQ